MNDEPLGKLSGEPRDDRLQPGDDRLKLPRNAFIAFRQSGGLRFSTREVIVYNDGRVISRQQGKLGSGESSQRLTPDEVAELKEMTEQSGLFDRPASIGRSSPDGYAYEILVRAQRKTKHIETFTGSVPAALQSMIQQLQGLMQANEQD